MKKNDINKIAKFIKNKKYIFVIGPEFNIKNELIKKFKELPEFKDYQIETYSNFLTAAKTNLTDKCKFIELKTGKEIEEYFDKNIDVDIQLWEFLEYGAVISVFPKDYIRNSIDLKICNNSSICIETENNIEICVLSHPQKVRYGFYGYAEAFRKHLKRKLEVNKAEEIKDTNITEERTLDVKNTEEAKEKISDIKVIGNPDMWKLITKVSSESQGFMKSTKAMDVGNGCLVQVTTQQRNPDGSYSISEAITFVPNVQIKVDKNGNKYIKEKKKR